MKTPVLQSLLFLALAFLVNSSLNAQTVVRYIHTDALGSVVAVTDENRNVVERREYEPYGAQLTPALQDGPGYTGHVQDAATGLVYMQQRYYDPGIGRFLSVDPVTAYDTGDWRQLNRYAYAFNNPYRFTDPDGRYSCEASVCASVKTYVAALRTSRGELKRGSSEYRRVDRALRYIGTEGSKGPNYVSADFSGSEGTTARTDQLGNTQIDVKKLDGSANAHIEGARSIAHEADHDLSARDNGIATTESAVRASETSAYATEAAAAKGLGVHMSKEGQAAGVEASVDKWKARQEDKK